MRPKRLHQSRTMGVLAAALAVVLARVLAKHLPGDLAHTLADVLSDELVALVCTVATTAAGAFKAQDYAERASVARARKVGELIADKENRR